jgi:hypothetical protein
LSDQYKRLEALMDTDPDEAARQASVLLDKNYEDPGAMFLIASVFCRAEKYGMAANLFKRLTELKPDRSEPWNNFGMCLSGMNLHLKARVAYTKAWERKKTGLYAANIAITYMEMREHKKALEWCEKSLAIEPECRTALTTRGLSRLATGQWAGGWADGASSIGGKFRKELRYRDEGRWDGKPGANLVIYGEQGLGDEIMYASCVPDAMRENTVIVECDPRLQGLFRRSFACPVYGTRRVNEIEWPNDHTIDAGIPCGQLPQFYRPTPQSCPGTPYLVADPERRLQWRALFDSWGKKPKIGIAWSGGSKHNNPGARTIGLDGLRPLFQSIDADWVSLQYKDPSAEIEAAGLPIRHFARACETPDYDDAAALVAELDLVIGVHTSALHLAGALGVPTITIATPQSNWAYQGDSIPWYACATLFKKAEGETWPKAMERLSNDPALHRIRSPRVGGVSRLQPVGDSDRYLPGSVAPACAELAA